jgi:hypothetical protein
MERSWIDTVHLLGLDVVVLVVITLLAVDALWGALRREETEPRAGKSEAKRHATLLLALYRKGRGDRNGVRGPEVASEEPAA